MNKQQIGSIFEKIDVPFIPGPAKNIAVDAIGIKCPFCANDPSAHCGIFEGDANYSCWRCRESGPFIKLLRQLTGESEEYCKQLIDGVDLQFKEDSSVTLTNIIDGPMVPTDRPLNRAKFDGLPQYFDEIKPEIKFPLLFDYLKRRNISLNTVIKYHCGVCCFGKYMNRMIIPVFFNEKVVSYQAADLTGRATLKYATAPGDINNYLYNYDSIKYGGRLIITEGIPDCWRSGDDAVATFGTHITDRQFHLMLDKHPSEIIFCRDEDYYTKVMQYDSEAGEFLPFCDKIKIIRFPENEDPDSFGARFGESMIQELIANTEYWTG